MKGGCRHESPASSVITTGGPGANVTAAEQLGLPTLILMENAGRGAAAWLVELAAGLEPEIAARPFSTSPSAEIGLTDRSALPKFLILSGPGNNGGDGGVVVGTWTPGGSRFGLSGSRTVSSYVVMPEPSG